MLTAVRSLLLLLLAAPLFFSCGEESEPEPPSYVLTKDRFAELLVDLSLAESATSINILMVKGRELDSAYAFNPLLEHSISPELYDSTLRYYARNPEQYKEVYQKALNILSTLESARRTKKADTVIKKRTTKAPGIHAGFKVRSDSL